MRPFKISIARGNVIATQTFCFHCWGSYGVRHAAESNQRSSLHRADGGLKRESLYGAILAGKNDKNVNFSHRASAQVEQQKLAAMLRTFHV